MDLPQIGAHCSLSACNILDFLPIKCRCNKLYCSAHINPDHHACRATSTISLSPNIDTGTELHAVCVLDGCKKAGLSKETCSACHRSFCVDHRHPETHSCSPNLKSNVPGSLHQTEQKTIPAYGLSLPKQSFQARHKKLPADPFKFEQYQKMETLKMRHRASPGDPKSKSAFVPPDQRLHLRISIDDVERVFWFRKTLVTGKVLDLLSVHLKVALYDTQARQLCKFLPGQNEYLHLRNDLPLIDQVDDGSIVIVQSI